MVVNHLHSSARQVLVQTYETLLHADDASVIAAFRSHRSEAAAQVLIERFSPRLLRTVARLLGPHAADAEDVLQESWIRGLDALHQYRGEGFVTWMTRIALRCALDFLRRRDTRTALRSLDDARTIPDASGDPDLSQDLERGLAQLSPHARMTVVMHDIEGFTHQEIAQTLGIAVGTSKAHLFQARRKLRGWLDAHSSEENTA